MRVRLSEGNNHTNGSIKKVRKTSGKTADVNMLKRPGSWIKDSLLLIDLGYFSYSIFDRIQRNQGYFISRLKDIF